MKLAVHLVFALLAWANAAALAAESEGEVDAIRQCAESYVAAYNQGDADALAALWAEDGVYTDPESGESIVGREAIREMFAKIFEVGHGAQLGVTIHSIRLITPDVAIEDGTAEITSPDGAPEVSEYAAIHVKKDGVWQLNSVRETATPTPPTSRGGELEQLAWLEGEWVDESEDAAVHTTWQWSKNRKFLTGTFSIVVGDEVALEGTQVIGWAATRQQLRSWTFDSDGGISEGIWQRHGDEWVVDSATMLADGGNGCAVNVYRMIDPETFAFRSIDRVIDGEAQPEIDEVLVRRQTAPTATESAATIEPAEGN